ncbi:MAG: ABC transporter substrate-binding protein [Nitrososphaerales archaeon]
MLAVLVVTACSGGRAPQPAQPAPEPPAATASDPAGAQAPSIAARKIPANSSAAAAVDGGPILNPDVSGAVELWHFWGSPVRHNALRRVIALCQQKLPNITVSEAVKPFGDIWTANLAAVAAGSGMPDVIVSNRPALPRDAADGVYMSLLAWADRDNVRREQFYNWAWDQGVYDGQIYGIPHETDVRVLFYNKTMFEQAGLDPDKPPATWADVEKYADKLDKIGADGKIERIAFFPLWNVNADVWQYTNDGTMMKPDGTPQIDNPKMVETTEWIKKWVDRYGGWDKLQSFRNQFAKPDDLFMSSAVAMYADIFGYTSQLQFYRPTVRLDTGQEARLDWGVALLPYNTRPGTWSGGFAMSIPVGAKHPEAAWEFIKCATSSESQVSWARDTQAQPTNLKAATDPSLLADPNWQIVDRALQSSTGGVYVSKYPNWTEQLMQRWELVWRGELPPAQMLGEAQKAVEEALQ